MSRWLTQFRTNRCIDAFVRSGSRPFAVRTTSPLRCATPCATAASPTPTCSAGRAARARPRRPASWLRRSTVRTLSTASPATYAKAAGALRPAGRSTCRNSTPPPTTASMRCATSLVGSRSPRRGVGRCTSSTRCTCCRRRPSNALLKTLEEPPSHVVFVLATTDPQKVLPTIRSRTQHYEFRLIAGDVLNGLVRDIAGRGRDRRRRVVARRRDAPRPQGSARVTHCRRSTRSPRPVAWPTEDNDAAAEVVDGARRTRRRAAHRRRRRRCKPAATPVASGEDVLAMLRHAFLALMAPEFGREARRQRDPHGSRRSRSARRASRAPWRRSATR